MSDERLIDLETKYLHQEMALDKIQQALGAQDEVILKLEKTVKQLNEKVSALLNGGAQAPVNEKPPHY
jgi:uncharacterized coiled-coil protein SlyX